MKNYKGYLIAANPRNPRDDLYKTVMIVVSHTSNISIALQINTPHQELTLSDIFETFNLDNYGEQPIYFGGNLQLNKIHLVHSLDWRGPTTVPLTPEIGITYDISIIEALSKNQGPEYFRACAGFRSWENGHFDIQLDPNSLRNTTSSHIWELCPATIENTFLLDPRDQWQDILKESARFAVSNWLDF